LTQTPRRERTLCWLLAGIQFTLLLDFMVMMPLGPELMQKLQLSPAQFGGLVSSYTLASALCGASGLLWLDRFSRKQTLTLLYATFTAATLGCGLATHGATLLAARVAAGACAGLLWAVVLDIIADLVPAERRGKAIGFVMSAYAVAAVAGVPLGLFLAGWLSFRAPFLLIAGLSAALWLAALRLVPSASRDAADESTGSLAALLGDSQSIRGWLLTFAVVSAGFLMIPFLATHFVGNLKVSRQELGLVYLCGGAVTFFTSRLVGGWVDRFGPQPVLAALLFASALPHLVVTQLEAAPLWAVIVTFIAFMTLTSGRMIPTLALLTSSVPRARRGRFLAVNSAVSDAASGAAAWFAGAQLTTTASGELLGFGRIGLLAVAVSLIAALVLATFQRRANEVTL
jgi:MFS transporter, DHA1 family, inner membrane transport protein